MLYVVTAYSNPVGWSSRRTLYRTFERHMRDSGVHLTTVECAYGEAAFDLTGCCADNYIQVRADALLWHKENLLNIGFTSLPQEANYVVWADADITFLSPTWAADTIAALSTFDVVQPWTVCRDLDAYDNLMLEHRAFCEVARSGEPIIQGPNVPEAIKRHAKFGHPGYAWAAKRSTIDAMGGVFDLGILGSGDHHMALAFLGRAHDSLPWDASDHYLRALLTWQRRARACVRDIGSVAGTIAHGYHGSKKNRRYLERWNILTKHRFDPDSHLRRNEAGVLELQGAPEMAAEIAEYFRSRDEDG